MRNFCLILSSVFFVVGSIFFYYKIKLIPSQSVVQFREKIGSKLPAVNPGNGGSQNTHDEVFIFTEADKNDTLRHDIFIYDSSTQTKKQLTGIKNDPRKNLTKFNINPQFGPYDKKIYFVEKDNSDNFNLCSLKLDEDDFNVLRSSISTPNIYVDTNSATIFFINDSKSIWKFDIMDNTSKKCFTSTFQSIDFPMLSPDREKLYYAVNLGGSYSVGQVETFDGNPSEVVLFSGNGHLASIELSPDGRFFLLTFGKDTIEIFDSYSKLQFIPTIKSDIKSQVVGATWSADSKSIYWTRNYPYNNIEKFNIDGIKPHMESEVIVSDFTGFFVSLKKYEQVNLT